jgi:hypothetical protein
MFSCKFTFTQRDIVADYNPKCVELDSGVMLRILFLRERGYCSDKPTLKKKQICLVILKEMTTWAHDSRKTNIKSRLKKVKKIELLAKPQKIFKLLHGFAYIVIILHSFCLYTFKLRCESFALEINVFIYMKPSETNVGYQFWSIGAVAHAR